MKPLFVNWWQKICSKDLERHITYKNLKLSVKQSSDNIPYLSLEWTVENGSETNISIKRAYGTIYMGDRRIANFDVYKPIHKKVDASINTNI